jgi:hypothetical protein
MKVFISLSRPIPEWFKKLPREEQKEYLKEHPQSRLGHSSLKKAVVKVSDTAVKAKISAKHIAKEERAFFKDGADEAGSEHRRSFGLLIKQKLHGVMKAMKHEVKEFKMAGAGLVQLAHGKKIDDHQKKAIKTVLIHSLMVLGPMAISGGLSAGLVHALPHAVGGFLEHSLVVSAARAAVFAAEAEPTAQPAVDPSEELMAKLIEKFAEYVANGDISRDEWKEAFAKAKDEADA